MNINEAKNILNENNYILLEASYKNMLLTAKKIFGSNDKTVEAIEDYVAVNSATEAKEYLDVYGNSGITMVKELLGNFYCIRDLKLDTSLHNKRLEYMKSFNKFIEEYYINNENVKDELISIMLEYTKNIQDASIKNIDSVIEAGAKQKPYEYRCETFKEIIDSKWALETLFSTTQHSHILKKAGFECPVSIKVNGVDLKKYFEKNPQDYKKYGNYYAEIHQYSHFYYVVENGIDTWSFQIRPNGGSVGNYDALKACSDDAILAGYIDWRHEHNNTWDITIDKLVKVIKAFKSYPSKLSEEQLETYKKNVKNYEEYNRGVAEFYATARYTGD